MKPWGLYRIEPYWAIVVQDPILGWCVRAHDAAPAHDSTHAGKNWVSHYGHLIKHDSM